MSRIGRDDFADAGLLQLGDVGGRQQMRLAKPLVAGIGRVREDRADRIVDRDRPEFHAASSFLRRPAPRVLSALMISASTATAISAGLDAPISMPIGEWMRAI